MEEPILLEDAAYLLLVSVNTIRGYTTVKGGEKFKFIFGRVPPEAMPSLFEYRISTLESQKEKCRDLVRKRKLKEFHILLLVNI